MSRKTTSPEPESMVRYTRETVPKSPSDWARLEVMTDDEVMAAALSDPDALPVRPEDRARMMPLVNVKRLRERLGLSQEAFAATYGIPPGTLRDWEQRRRMPDAPARAYLRVIDANPESAAAALAGHARRCA